MNGSRGGGSGSGAATCGGGRSSFGDGELARFCGSEKSDSALAVPNLIQSRKKESVNECRRELHSHHDAGDARWEELPMKLLCACALVVGVAGCADSTARREILRN